MPKRKATHTGEKQAKKPRPGKNGNFPPVEHQFKKGDPRINRNGRPHSFDQVRVLFQDVASDVLPESTITRIHAMALAMTSSRNPNDRRLFLEYAFGKVPDESKVHDWHDEVIQALKEDLISPLELIRVLGLDDARPLLLAAGIGESVDAASATAVFDSAETQDADAASALS